MAVPRHRLVRLLAIVTLVAGGGCFQYQEDVWVYEDHSGRVESQVRVPAGVWSEALRTRLVEPSALEARCARVAASIDGVELVSFDQVATSEHHRLYWVFSFSDPAGLAELLQTGSEQAIAVFPFLDDYLSTPGPRASVEQLGRLTTIHRTLPPLPAAVDTPGAGTRAAEHVARFRVHMPHAIVVAPNVARSADGRTATWEISLAELFAEGVDIRASYRRPFPAGPVLGSLLALVLGVGGIWGFAYLHMARGLREGAAELEESAAAAPAAAEDSWADESFPPDSDSGDGNL